MLSTTADNRQPARPWIEYPDTDRGSGTVLGLAVVGCFAAIITLTLPLYIGTSQLQAVNGAADAAALAAADVASGISPGSPCSVATVAANSNNVSVDSCTVDGLVVSVRVEKLYLGFSLVGSATAGPAETVSN